MTKPVTFTKTNLRRAISGARQAGLKVKTIRPDGFIELDEHQPRRRGPLGDGLIYIIAAGEFIKIGFTTDLTARVRYLQVANPMPLTVLGTLPGSVVTEKMLHNRFMADRTGGEWFRRSPAFEAWLTETFGGKGR